MTVDEVVTPQMGNCTLFARYVEPAFATQVILTARLTRLYECEDWAVHLGADQHESPMLLERGVSLHESAPPLPPDSLSQAAQQVMDKIEQQTTRTTSLQVMRDRRRAKKEGKS